jgi:hypothetical protein
MNNLFKSFLGRGKPEITETVDTASVDTGAQPYFPCDGNIIFQEKSKASKENLKILLGLFNP